MQYIPPYNLDSLASLSLPNKPSKKPGLLGFKTSSTEGRPDVKSFGSATTATGVIWPYSSLKVKDKILISGIIRNEEVIIPSGEDMILENDNVIVVTINQFLDELTDILR